MSSFPTDPFSTSPQFKSLLPQSIKFFQYAFLSYFTISVLAFLPFVAFNLFSHSNFLEIEEFIHGVFVDILVFLTFPTLFSEKKVYPIATIQLFLQRFFASSVLIGLLQMGVLFLFLSFFAQISFGLILVGVIPYLFTIFAGFFLIFENSAGLIDVNKNVLRSAQLVKQFFIPVFQNFLMISLIIILPMFLFSIWFISNNEELAAIIRGAEQGAAATRNGVEVLSLIQDLVQTASFQWGRVSIHILFRPLKSIFLSILFLSLVYKINPKGVISFLGLTEQNVDTSLTEPPSTDLN